MKIDKSTETNQISGTSRRRGPHVRLERRLHPRLRAIDFRVWLGWWSVDSEFAMLAARFENISRGGALVASSQPLEVGAEVWMKLGASDYPDCVRAEVLDVLRVTSGDYLVRLRFDDGCPDRFFDVVTRGLGLEETILEHDLP